MRIELMTPSLREKCSKTTELQGQSFLVDLNLNISFIPFKKA